MRVPRHDSASCQEDARHRGILAVQHLARDLGAQVLRLDLVPGRLFHGFPLGALFLPSFPSALSAPLRYTLFFRLRITDDRPPIADSLSPPHRPMKTPNRQWARIRLPCRSGRTKMPRGIARCSGMAAIPNLGGMVAMPLQDRKSTRLNSSH